MKRLAFLVPLLMFKMGVMFTLLVVATLTSTKGLMVASLLLALGVGHFIANRLVTCWNFCSQLKMYTNLPKNYPKLFGTTWKHLWRTKELSEFTTSLKNCEKCWKLSKSHIYIVLDGSNRLTTPILRSQQPPQPGRPLTSSTGVQWQEITPRPKRTEHGNTKRSISNVTVNNNKYLFIKQNYPLFRTFTHPKPQSITNRSPLNVTVHCQYRRLCNTFRNELMCNDYRFINLCHSRHWVNSYFSTFTPVFTGAITRPETGLDNGPSRSVGSMPSFEWNALVDMLRKVCFGFFVAVALVVVGGQSVNNAQSAIGSGVNCDRNATGRCGHRYDNKTEVITQRHTQVLQVGRKSKSGREIDGTSELIF